MTFSTETGRLTTPRIEFAFGADLNADPATWVWTDVSDRLLTESISITRGRADESSETPPSTTNFTLDNGDGALTPDNPSSPWFPFMRRNTPVRVSIFANSVWHVRFTGHVSEIVPRWPYGDLSTETSEGEARVDIAAAGILRRLSQGAKPARSVLFRHITATPQVWAYWPLEDQRLAVNQAASALAGVDPMNVYGFTFDANDSLVASKPLPRIEAGVAGGFSVTLPAAPAPAPTKWAVSWFMHVSTFPTTGRIRVMGVQSTGYRSRFDVWLESAAASPATFDVIALENFIGEAAADRTVVEWDPDAMSEWNLMRLQLQTVSGSHSWRISVIPLPPSPSAGIEFGDSHTYGNIATQGIGIPTRLDASVSADGEGISIGHVAVDSELPDTDWLYTPAAEARAGERAGRRIETLFTEDNINFTLIGDPGPTGTGGVETPGDSERMGAQRARSLLELVDECVTADTGLLIERRDTPGFTYKCRPTFYNQTPTLTLDAATNEITNPFEPVLDDQRIRNDVRVEREEGSSARNINQTSIDAEDHYDSSKTFNLYDDSQLKQQVAWRLSLGSWPGMRYPQIATELSVAPDRITDWLATELGDRLHVTNLPPQHPATTVDVLIEGYTETLSPTRWTVAINASPAKPWDIAVLDDATDRLDSDNSTLDADITEVTLGFPVAVDEGPLWTTNPASFPFDILVTEDPLAATGEQMTVTNITDATSPQFFFVTRPSPRPNLTGTAVHVANPIRLAW